MVSTSLSIRRFFGEARRRKVIGAVVAYAIASAGVMQVADVVAPRMNLPDATVTIIILVAMSGLPIVAVLAWFYDIVPETSTAAIILPVPVGNAVAVLPFANLSAEPADEYFADGVTEDVISTLSKISQLNVISRRSVMEFKRREQSLREIGAALGATTILEGSVRHAGDRVRIVAQLVDVQSDHNLWTETYDRQLNDVFAIQTDVALHIAAALQAQLSPDEKLRIGKQPTSDMQAYQLYLQGRRAQSAFTDVSLQSSLDLFEQAIALDPRMAVAYAGIAMTYAELGETGMVATDVAYPKAREAVTKALAIDPDLADAHTVLAQLHVFDFEWEKAENGFKRALQLSPSNADAWGLYGRMCAAQGRHDDAIAMQRRSHLLDPLEHQSDLTNAVLRAGKYEEAVQLGEAGVRKSPDYDRAHMTLAWAYLLSGRVPEGIAEIEKALVIAPRNTGWLAQLGQAYGLTGQREKAREVLATLEQRARETYVSPYSFAYVHVGLGEYDKAMDYLETAYRQRAGAIYGIKGSFLFKELRTHPRFIALLKKMNLTS